MANPNELKARLVATAEWPASARDTFGDTLGSFSGMSLDLASWTKAGAGHRVRLFTLPDRGFNTPSKGEYSDYPGRVHEFELTIPKSGGAGLKYVSSQYLRDADGAQTTGLDPGASTKRHLGLLAPAAERGLRDNIPRRLSLDAEGLARREDGSFYVSDEFSCCIYFCDAHGRMLGAISPPPSIAPRKSKRPHFTSDDDDPPDTGRQPNDGFEGVSLSPDGKTLFALMQSPLVQDVSDGEGGERYVRLVTYDVSKVPCPAAPSGHYVVELPLFQADKKSTAPETNCVLALDDCRFLLLARDGGGFGDRKGKGKGKGGTSRPIRFKQILQGKLDPAANVAGTPFDNGTKSVFFKDGLDPKIISLPLWTAIDLCNEPALNAIGLTVEPGKRGFQQISAKWESMALTPPLKSGGRERYLLVGNDNDFLTRDGMMPDRAYDAGIDNPNMILIYRVMIP